MKKIIVALFIWLCTIAHSQIVNIPDTILINKLLNANTTTSTIAAYGTYPDYLFTKIDTNNDGFIQYSEAAIITYLFIAGNGIADLTGIEAFTNLQYFNCTYNNISSLSSTSGLLQLESLFFRNNQVANVDLNNLSNLHFLDSGTNPISSLNFANNSALEIVFCNNNLLTSLDFSNNPLFNQLDCKNNPNLASINIKNGAIQLLGPQTYNNQCWSGLPNLSTICADANELSALNSYLTSCGINTSTINYPANCALGNAVFDKKGFEVYPNPNDGRFTINFNATVNDATIEIYNLIGQKIDAIVVNNSNQYDYQNTMLAAGAYLVKITCNDESIIKRIIIK